MARQLEGVRGWQASQTTACCRRASSVFRIPAGRHSLVMRYEPESWKAALGFAGLLGVLLLMALEWRAGWRARLETWTPAWALAARQRASAC